MPTPAPGQAPLYAGTVDCVLKTVKGEGVKGLYKGKNETVDQILLLSSFKIVATLAIRSSYQME